MSARTLAYPTRDDLLVPRQPGRSTADRLRASYVVDADGCWRWTRALATNGYGHLSMRSVYYQAHLLMYALEVGPLPVGLEPDHLCRHRYCIRPTHLDFVTHAVNMQRGLTATLTPEQVDEIRWRVRRGEGQRAIAPEYGIDHSQISKIVNGLSWADRPFPVAAVA